MTIVCTEEEWIKWLGGPDPTCVYFVMTSRTAHVQAWNTLAMAWKAACDRRVYLFQRRASYGFDYLAVKPAKGLVPLRLAPLRKANYAEH